MSKFRLCHMLNKEEMINIHSNLTSLRRLKTGPSLRTLPLLSTLCVVPSGAYVEGPSLDSRTVYFFPCKMRASCWLLGAIGRRTESFLTTEART